MGPRCSSQVYVGGLAIRADEKDLRCLMEPFGINFLWDFFFKKKTCWTRARADERDLRCLMERFGIIFFFEPFGIIFFSVNITDVSFVREHKSLTFWEFICILGIITDVSVVRDNDTELSRGFAFVTFENEEMASKAIQDMNRRELPTVCPPHGRLVLKKAEKSRQQKEWEKVLLVYTSLYTHSQKFSRYASFPVSLTVKWRKSGKRLSLSKVLCAVLSLLTLKSSLCSTFVVGSSLSLRV